MRRPKQKPKVLLILKTLTLQTHCTRNTLHPCCHPSLGGPVHERSEKLSEETERKRKSPPTVLLHCTRAEEFLCCCRETTKGRNQRADEIEETKRRRKAPIMLALVSVSTEAATVTEPHHHGGIASKLNLGKLEHIFRNGKICPISFCHFYHISYSSQFRTALLRRSCLPSWSWLKISLLPVTKPGQTTCSIWVHRPVHSLPAYVGVGLWLSTTFVVWSS